MTNGSGLGGELLLNTGDRVTGGSIVNYAFALCEFREADRPIFDRLVETIKNLDETRPLALDRPLRKALEEKGMLAAHPEEGVVFHREALPVARAVLKDILSGAGGELRNPLPLGHAKYQEIEALMREAQRQARENAKHSRR